MVKAKELSHPFSCLNKAAMDEPVFVLRAHDPNAPATLRTWAHFYHDTKTALRGRLTTTQLAKHSEALALANEMEHWYHNQAQFEPETLHDGGPYPPVVAYFKIIDCDMFDGDYPNEKFVEPLPPKLTRAQADRICDAICLGVEMHSPRYWRVVPEDYKLQPGFTA